MIIIGAGLSGIIAGHYFKQKNPHIQERQLYLPNNHHALLRFKTDKVSKVTNIPFKEGIVRKSILADGQFADKSNPYLANTYSLKVLGKIVDRSIWDLEDGPRYVAPLDFIDQASKGLAIKLGKESFGVSNSSSAPIISTIPMPQMMDLVGWKNKPRFEAMPIWSIQVDIISPEVDVFQTIYYASLKDKYYRASITGNRLIIEYHLPPPKDEVGRDIDSILGDFGIVPYATNDPDPAARKHEYGKIAPIDEDLRKEFIYTMTREYNVYSLGRFATWKQILLDDVVDDCFVISKLMASEGRRRQYHHSISTVKGTVS